LNFFIENELIAPEEEHLELIVRFALRAQEFFLASALFFPDQIQLDHFFDEFVWLCALPAPPHSSDSGFESVCRLLAPHQISPRIEPGNRTFASGMTFGFAWVEPARNPSFDSEHYT
jgi:hypothetical protein